MGFAERANKMSEVNRKHEGVPVPLVPYDFSEPILIQQPGELAPRDNRLTRFIKKMFLQKE